MNWDEQTLQNKINNIAKMIKNYNNGKGADIVVMEEVENINVLQKLVDTGLKGLGYKSVVLIEGSDTRGIDVGMISRFPVVSKKLHKMDLSDVSGGKEIKTRGILEVKFSIGDKNVAILGNHWPSPGNPDEYRLKAAENLLDIAKSIKDAAVIAVGDFNTLSDDYPHGINEVILNSKNGSKYYFLDSEAQSLAQPLYKHNKGTHWFNGDWNSLDRIFVLQGTSTKLYPDWSSFTYNMPEFALGKYDWVDNYSGETTTYQDVPKRFNPKSGKGYSDHVGIAITVGI